jgi:hypothetical protein
MARLLLSKDLSLNPKVNMLVLLVVQSFEEFIPPTPRSSKLKVSTQQITLESEKPPAYSPRAFLLVGVYSN